MTRSFTLIELLIVIAVVAILSVVVILALNPAELLKQARDSTRLSDINAIHKALSLSQVDNPSASFGTASTTYISYPEPASATSTCTGAIGLSTSTLPSGWNYQCTASSSYQKVSGTGWIPVNLSSITGGSPLPNLPRDPINTTSSQNYYQYIGNSSNWAITALLESQKYLAQSGHGDGGYDPGRFEKGSSLALISQGESLVGWWTFDEGSGTIANDASGNGNTGNASGTAVVSGKLNNARSFNGAGDYVDAGNNAKVNFGTGNFSVLAWIKPNGSQNSVGAIVDKYSGPGFFVSLNGFVPRIFIQDVPSYIWVDAGTTQAANGAWSHFAATFNRASYVTAYLNGASTGQVNISSKSGTVNNGRNLFIGHESVDNGWFNGQIDEVMIYNRALSAAEIAAIYNATK